MPRDIRVAVVGDEGVGKSTIILALIKEAFVEVAPQSCLPEVTIPPLGSHSGGLIIVDTSPRREDRVHLENAVRLAHVVVIVYAVDDAQSFDKIQSYWLPTIRALGVNVPVVLVGNKIDLRGGQVTNQALEDEIIPIMNEFKEVETCVECSAKIPLNIAQVFYFSQRSVLHPTAPLYDSREHTLKPACVNALRRIFMLCDQDKDGLLNDYELNEFQRKCFSAPLQQNELEGIKHLVREYDPDSVVDNGLTETGFLYLNTLFIQRGRLETTWAMLRTFGYGDDVTLQESFLQPRFDVPADCSVELSPKGYNFFAEIFDLYDKDRDGALNADELAALFSTSPGNPFTPQGFPSTTVTTHNDAITLQGWLAQWSCTTLLDHKTTLAYLAYLGYPHSTSDPSISSTTALQITKPRKSERRKGKVTRQVFLAYVLGAAGSGKSAILRAFVGKQFASKYEPTSRLASVVNSVEMRSAEKYLVLQEFGSTYEPEVLRNSKKLNQADVLVFVYDSSDTNSFSYLSNLRQQYKLDSIPSIFVATKSDLDLAQQRHEVQPDVYCQRLGLQVPVAVSPRQGQLADLYQIICSVATNPSTHIPGHHIQTSKLSVYLSVGAIAGLATLSTYLLIRNVFRPAGGLWAWINGLGRSKLEL